MSFGVRKTKKPKVEGSTRLTYLGFRGGLEHLKIKTRLLDKRVCECDRWLCDLDPIESSSILRLICSTVVLERMLSILDLIWGEHRVVELTIGRLCKLNSWRCEKKRSVSRWAWFVSVLFFCNNGENESYIEEMRWCRCYEEWRVEDWKMCVFVYWKLIENVKDPHAVGWVSRTQRFVYYESRKRDDEDKTYKMNFILSWIKKARTRLFIMNQESESYRQDLYMSVGEMKD
jgi:hypothetical protein